ncbi:MAG: GAF domain-containing protein [Candidatus Sulfotelmatobacter sp.]
MFDEPHPAPVDEIAERAALYCLGDFSAEDSKSYEVHLSACAVCRTEVEKYSAIVADLALAEAHQPSSKQRVDFLKRIRQEKAKGRLWERLRDVLITPQLSVRPAHEKNRAQIDAALNRLAMASALGEQDLLDALVGVALDLCHAGTAGFSMLYEDEQIFRWDALAGALTSAKGGTTPRDWSPCGTTLDLGTPQLFTNPSRCFEYFSDAPREICEGLVVPVYIGEKPLGTLWIASHDDRKFDQTDLQVLQTFADYCGAAVAILREGNANPNSQVAR